MKTEAHQPTLAFKLCGVGFFTVFALTAFLGFFSTIWEIIKHTQSASALVIFERGSMYGLGCGLGCLVFVIRGWVESIFGKNILNSANHYFIKVLLPV
ncbi:hypothetical protein [Aliikangiella maris]|uniref:Uncharacterized protein n=2 Tax=Aliikangiella maris TaxID=3162458 RepID=A0ABV2BUQ9_9GAMM